MIAKVNHFNRAVLQESLPNENKIPSQYFSPLISLQSRLKLGRRLVNKRNLDMLP